MPQMAGTLENFAQAPPLDVLTLTIVHIDCFVPAALKREIRSRGNRPAGGCALGLREC